MTFTPSPDYTELRVGTDAVFARIEPRGDEWVLKAFDYVVNEWEEPFSTLSLAIARLACLIECTERPEPGFFVASAAGFVPIAKQFFDTVSPQEGLMDTGGI